MRSALAASSAALLVLAAPAFAQSHGNGSPGHDKAKSGERRGNAGPAHAQRAPGNARPEGDRGPRADRAAPQRHPPAPGQLEQRGGPQRAELHAPPRAMPDQPRPDRRDIAHDRPVVAVGASERDISRGSPERRRIDVWRDNPRRGPDRVVRIEQPSRIQRLPVRTVHLIDGCPPGLASRGNGCLPPGQARRIAEQRHWYDSWWQNRTRGDADQYRYADGYLYRISPANDTLVSWLPLLGGALSVGNPWPSGYAAETVPDYYVDYYGYSDPSAYRYANGVLYGVDPQTQAIQSVAALMTGDEWSIGSPMPAGYGVYNVPYAYRSRYQDTPQSWYRYSDGYVYQVDPTTRLVQAAIQLLS